MLVAAAALLAVGGVWLALRQAELLVDRALAIVLGPGTRAQRSIRIHTDGQIVVDDLVFHPADAPDAVRVERLLMETPGWRWFLANALDPDLLDARLDRLRLRLNGMRVDNDGALPLQDLAVFGVTSASPWDADGCPTEVRWTRQTLTEAGLTPGSTSLQFDYRAQAGDLLATVVLETYGVSRLQWLRIGTLPSDEGNLLRLAAESSLFRSEYWEVQDQGFVTARNRYCASKGEVHLRHFVTRHVDSVARRLATVGLQADDDTWDRYRRFVLLGGKLSLSVGLPRPMSASALLQLHRSAAWSDTVTTLDRSGNIGPLRWHRTTPAPSPSSASDASADTGLQPGLADGFEPVPSQSEPPAIDAGIAAVPPPTADVQVEAPPPTTEMQVEAPDETRSEAPTTSAATQPASEPPGPLSEPAPRIAPASRATQLAIPPLTRFVPPAPESATRAAVLSTAPVAPTRPAASAPKPLTWNELRTLRGRTIEIWTRHSPARRVQLLEFGNDAVRVTYRIKNSGEATFSIRRDSFVRAVLKS